MKKLILVLPLVFSMVFSINTYAQTQKADTRSQLVKEDPYNMYQAENVNSVDILEALDLAGIQIKKCSNLIL